VDEGEAVLHGKRINREGDVRGGRKYERKIEANHGNGAPSKDSQMLDQLAMRMAEKLRLKYEGEIKNKGPGDGKGGASAEENAESLAGEVMSNTCPICFELFLPPEHSPILIIPCGHTFCKGCLEDMKKKAKYACPFCRIKIQSQAPNISLQKLIMTANKQAQPIPSKPTKKEGNIPHGASPQMPPDITMLNIRCEVLGEEKSAALKELKIVRDEAATRRMIIEKLRTEEVEALKRLSQVQKELELISKYISTQKDELEEMEDKKSEIQKNIKTIDETLKPLMMEKEKARMLMKY